MSVRAGIYLDANAGAPLKPAAVAVVLSLFENPQRVLIPNASSIHSHGRLAKRLMAGARENIASSLGHKIDPEQLIFTSSGSEANQLAIRSVLESKLSNPPANGNKVHWITTSVEHDSIRQMAEWVTSRGGEVSILPVNQDGILDLSILRGLIRPETALVSAVWVNNETGVITDIQALASITRAHKIPLHVDAAQAWGKLPMDLHSLGAQFVCLSGHKIGGLAGTGVLWLERGHPAHAVILGKQEKGRRGGSENLIGMITVGEAAKNIHIESWVKRVTPLRDRLQQEIIQRIPGALVNGGNAPRVANTLSLSFEGIEGDGLVMALDLSGYSVSAGSACASGVLEPSHVLTAMGRTNAQAMAAIRISLEDELPWEQLEGFIVALGQVVERIRRKSSPK